MYAVEDDPLWMFAQIFLLDEIRRDPARGPEDVHAWIRKWIRSLDFVIEKSQYDMLDQYLGLRTGTTFEMSTHELLEIILARDVPPFPPPLPPNPEEA